MQTKIQIALQKSWLNCNWWTDLRRVDGWPEKQPLDPRQHLDRSNQTGARQQNKWNVLKPKNMFSFKTAFSITHPHVMSPGSYNMLLIHSSSQYFCSRGTKDHCNICIMCILFIYKWHNYIQNFSYQKKEIFSNFYMYMILKTDIFPFSFRLLHRNRHRS